MSRLHAPRDLTSLLAPRSVAVIGASDRSRWSQVAFANLSPPGFSGTLHLVNRRGAVAHGRPCAVSCAQIGAPVDVGVVMVPTDAVAAAIEDLAAAGGRHAVILSSGFAELGESGRLEQDRIAAIAREAGVSVLGPNSLGLVNYLDGVALWTAPYRKPQRPGTIAVVSHSGQVAYHLANVARHQGVALSHLVTTGNEMDLDATDFVAHLIADDRVRAIALYLETVRRPERFVQVARQAGAAGMPLVVLKIGASEASARTAQAHTGALVGDDRAFDAMCEQYGVVRVHALEDLVITADLIARTGVLRPGGLGLMSNSGGICGIAADAAAKAGLPLPQLSPATVGALGEVLPDYATCQNPLDITGAAAADRALFEHTLRVLAADRAFGAVVCFGDLPASRAESDESLLAGLMHMGRAAQAADIPVLVMNCVQRDVTPEGQEIAAEYRLPLVAAGLDRGLAALGRAFRWSQFQRGGQRPREAARVGSVQVPLPCSEHTVLQLLRTHGVPVVPAVLAGSAQEAVDAAQRLGGAVAVKICSPDIAHKSEIGGVALDVRGPDAVREAYARVLAGAPPQARVEGVLVAPMRPRGLELIVGVSRDPTWGPMLVVGLGGIWVETLQDVALRQLPVDAQDVAEMLQGLKAAALFRGSRGAQPVDIAALARTIARIGDLALALGPRLEALEINPLRVEGNGCEALDALLVIGAQPPEEEPR
ncbi:acetate--CoA ligase family protein [Ramlibacter sp. AN1015]|uniref:acetate--CoA ligase family protein n=1 Tax=Ramlibacter sp. AN1015 TaxID=3133428 RepID=UPI0030C19645